MGPPHRHRVSTPSPDIDSDRAGEGRLRPQPGATLVETERSGSAEGETHLAAESLEWTVHLAAQHPHRAVIVGAAGLAVGTLAHLLFQNPVMTLFSVAVLVAATAEFLFPIRYRLDEKGAELRNLHNWRRIAWEEVKKVYTGEREIKLSPLEHGGRREAFRGVLLHCPDNRDEVLAFVRRHRDAAAQSNSGATDL
jgi:hypothetical protein